MKGVTKYFPAEILLKPDVGNDIFAFPDIKGTMKKRAIARETLWNDINEQVRKVLGQISIWPGSAAC
jgi:hypothetical protein